MICAVREHGHERWTRIKGELPAARHDGPEPCDIPIYRPATAHNARTIRANWGYVRPEKRKIGDVCRAIAAAAKAR
jgi:hypothetical protein